MYHQQGTTTTRRNGSSSSSMSQAELAVLDSLRSARGRGKDGLSDDTLGRLNLAVSVLEADGGVAGTAFASHVAVSLPQCPRRLRLLIVADACRPVESNPHSSPCPHPPKQNPTDPTTLPAINGKWRLLYTSRPGSASPIQRTFTGVEAFSIYQQVDLSADTPRVNNIVDFGERFGYLIVQAEASTDARPLEGFTPRRGEGLPFGIMGKSFNYKAARPNMRIDFQVGWLGLFGGWGRGEVCAVSSALEKLAVLDNRFQCITFNHSILTPPPQPPKPTV